MGVTKAFSEEQVSKLTNLSVGQLRSWDRTGLFVPSLADQNRRLPYSRAYSFVDLVSLRVIASLKFDHGVSTQHLKKAAARLRELGRNDWSSQTIYVLNKKVIFENEGQLEEIVSRQGVFKIPLKVAYRSAESDVERMFKRDKATIGKTSKARFVMNGEEVIAGTRIPVRSIITYLEMGLSDERIIEDYPDVTEADIKHIRESFEVNAA